MSENWVVQNLQNALTTWNEKLAEIWVLLTEEPEHFRGGEIWKVIVDIHGALQAIGIALLVLFFLAGMVKESGSFAEVKRPEQAVKVFIRFMIAKAVVTYGLKLMLAIFAIMQGIVGTIMRTARLGRTQGMILPDAMITAIEDCGFFEARGSAIKVMGEESEIVRFDKKLAELLAYYERYGHISPQVIDQIYDGGLSAVQDDPEDQHVIVYGNNGLVVRARTVNQERLLNLYDRNDLIFAIGPAGSGKTYTAIALAVRALKNREVKRIILTRPAVEAGEKLGFLPGDMKEKLDPYLQPLYDALNDMIPAAKLGKYVEDGTVQIAPLAYMRGRTLDNAFVILDEAQNTTVAQIKMFLTRMGRNARFIVTGDITQIDLPRRSDSGLMPVVEMLKGIDGIGIVAFDNRDIIRHRLVKHIVEAFERHAGNSEKE